MVTISAAVVLCAACAQTPRSLPPELENAWNTIRTAETFEREFAPNARVGFKEMSEFEKRQQRLADDLRAADADITKYLEQYPRDIRALMLQVRFDRVKVVAFPVTFGGGAWKQSGVPSPVRDPEKTLDRILEIDPQNGEASYWKARFATMSGMEVADGKMAVRKPDYAKAAQLARVAVESDPANLAYREALASILAFANDWTAARETLKPIDNGRDPRYRTLLDFDQIPLPAEAVFDSDLTHTYVEMTPVDFPVFRIKSYLFPGPASKVEEFYRAKWPELKLKREKKNVWSATLLWKQDRLVHAGGKTKSSWLDLDGFEITIMEDRETSPGPDVFDKERWQVRQNYEKSLLEEHPSDVRCTILLVNLHKFADR